MRKVIFGINITADGYCSHEDGIADAELHNYFTELLRKTDVILYGRKTYQLMVPYWPDLVKNSSEDEASNDFARVFDSLDLLVFSDFERNFWKQNENCSWKHCRGSKCVKK